MMGKIQARMIIEILGRPKEYIEESAVKLVDKLGIEKGVKVLEKKFHDAIPVEKSKDLFTTFTEVTVEFDNLEMYFAVIFAYMPANIEIIYPEEIILKHEDLNMAGNKIIQRMHEYDAIVKNTLARQDILTNKLKEVAPHLFKKPQDQTNSETPVEKVESKVEPEKTDSKKKKDKKKN